MNDRTDEFVFVGFWKRVLAVAIDDIIFFPLFYPVSRLVDTWAYEYRTVVPTILWFLLNTSFSILLVVRFGGSPGMLLIGVRIVDAGGRFLSWARALMREVFPLLLIGITGILVLWKVVATFPDDLPHTTGLERGELWYSHGQPFAMIYDVLCFAIFADIGLILFNQKKRAIHDFIAGSYVITKDSYRALGKTSSENEAAPQPNILSLDSTITQ